MKYISKTMFFINLITAVISAVGIAVGITDERILYLRMYTPLFFYTGTVAIIVGLNLFDNNFRRKDDDTASVAIFVVTMVFTIGMIITTSLSLGLGNFAVARYSVPLLTLLSLNAIGIYHSKENKF